MTRSIFIFLSSFVLTINVATAQNFSSQLWHDGWLVTTELDTLRGAVMYDMMIDAVKLSQGDVVKTFSARKLLFFTIFDQSLQSFRQFYSLPFSVSQGYKAPMVFEVLYEGPLTLLIREMIVEETVPAMYAYQLGPSGTRQRITYTYYFLDKNGNISEYTGKKQDLMVLMGKQAPKVKQFMKENKLRADRMRDLVRVTAFYNSLI